MICLDINVYFIDGAAIDKEYIVNSYLQRNELVRMDLEHWLDGGKKEPHISRTASSLP